LWAGCAAGAAQTFIIAPIDLIKTQMQVQCIGKRINSDYMGWRGTVRHIYRHAGVSGFTCGFMTCLVRDIPSFGAYFYTYELLVGQINILNAKSSGVQVNSVADLAKILFAGGFAGVMAWLISYPADVVKSRLQAQRFDKPLLYKSGMDCFRQGVKYEGWQFCWKGLGPTLIRAFPANAALFFTYQFVSDYLYRLNPDHFRYLSNSTARQT